MKKSKSLFVLAGLAALALPLAACNTITPPEANEAEQQIRAIYDKAVAEGLTDLTYEQWLDSIKGADGKDGKDGAAGADGADGATIITGEGAPTAENGKAGDLFIDTATYDLYKKGAEGWTKIGNIKGESGAAGSDFERAKHTVTFDTDGGTEIPDQQIMHGEKVARPDDPVKKGYTFVDWTYEGERWSFPGYVVTSDMTISAEYTANEYNITFDPGEGKLDTTLLQKTVTFDKVTDLPIPTRKAYTFAGWYLGEKQVNNGRWAIDEDVTLVAKYAGEDYTVTFDYNDGVTPNEVITANAENTEAKPNFVSVLKRNPERIGFTFLGWYKPDGTKENGNYFAKDEAADMTYTAHWSLNPTTFTGTTKDGNPVTVEFIDGGKVNVTLDETYEFQDWTTKESTTVSMSSASNQGLTYKTKGNTVTINLKYTRDGSTRTDSLVLDLDLTNNKAVVAQDLEMNGYYQADSHTVIAANSELTKPAEPVSDDRWIQTAGEYSYSETDYEYDKEIKYIITLKNGKITLSGDGYLSNGLNSNTGTYTVEGDVITATFKYFDDNEYEYVEITCTFQIDPTLASIKCTKSLANGADYGSLIDSGKVFNYVSGPTAA